MTRTLNVFLNQSLVGQLEQNRSGALSFGYDEAWIGSKLAIPLSHSLPLQSDRFRANQCRPFFAGLLPEEESRVLIAKAFGVSDKNDFAILQRIGAECAGAVSLLPLGELPVATTPDYLPITLAELAEKFVELPRRPLLTGENGMRLSLAGAQGKIVVAIRGENIFLPLGGSPSTHILKPENPRFDGLVENEFFCLRLAAQVNLDVAEADVGTAGKTRFLQVKRFDRHLIKDGLLTRIHQEDFCQALSIPPELKYQQEGGPNLKRCFELVRAVSSAPGPDLLKLFDAVVFNFLIGNGDAHGKNFSFLYADGQARLAPLYDLVCTQANPNLAAEMAMKIGGERHPARVGSKQWRKFFQEAGLTELAAGRRLRTIVTKVRAKAESLLNAELTNNKTVGPLVLENCRRLSLLE